MAIQLVSSREAATLHGLKMLVYGGAGAGKTRLCATTGASTVIISAEAGLLSLRDTDIATIVVKSWQELREAYTWAAQSQEAKGFDWLCLDSLSEIAETVLHHELAQTKDPRKAYGEMFDQMAALVRAFRDLPEKHVYMSAKMERNKDEATGTMLYQPSMPGQKLGQQLPYMFDEVFVLRAERDPQGALSRWLQTQPDMQYIAKDRSGALEAFEQPELGAIAAKIIQPTDQE